ncbi:MAG: Zn-ribbon domain-containing OB-fold protein [Acidimicrobiales bacterium]
MAGARTKRRVPAVEGWFTMDDEPALLGTRCRRCQATFFPREEFACRNPRCGARADQLEEVRLSRRGRVWSYTENHYAPPAPYLAADPFEPYALAAVELAEEQLVVLGQVVPGVGAGQLRVGSEVELTLGTLFEDDEATHVVWQWRPVETAS